MADASTTEVPVPFLHSRHKRLVIGMIVAIILSFSTFFWYFLNTIEVLVLRSDQTLTAFVNNKPLVASNRDDSVLDIMVNGNQKVLLEQPDGLKVGKTSDDLVFEETEAEITERTVIKEKAEASKKYSEWHLIKRAPPIGKYTLDLYSQEGGDVKLSITLTDRTGVYSKKIDRTLRLAPGKVQTYQIFYHKDVIGRTIFRPKPTYPVFQGLNILHAYFAKDGINSPLPRFIQP